MALLVSEQMQKRREQKFRRELTRALSVLPAKNLNGFISGVFDDFGSNPSPNDFVEMTMSSKFGSGNAVAEGGSGFLLEASLKVFVEAQESGSLSRGKIQPWGSRHMVMFDKSDCWNAAFLLEADAKLLSHAHNIRAEDYIWADEISHHLFLDRETHAFGFVIIPMTAMTLDEFKAYGGAALDGWVEGIESRFRKQGFCRYQIPGFDTGPMEYISPIHVKFGPIDKLIQLLPDRKRHEVSSHTRTFQSGKVTTVQAHRRKNPLRLVANNRALTDHIVYQVQDADGAIRYFGEGRSDRWKHVNSGVSHNRKINEHFFTRGEMTVKVVLEGLTKSEALSIERLLIRSAQGQDLWNIKDYEPFRPENERTMSEQEIADLSGDHF
ncbi:hypothetical protein [Pontitalea aquivivens]|uniref:hypothetical protein n=1 Tax=Pontitalea aquivivens TaxID=3388663 RepID=UPI00397050A1